MQIEKEINNLSSKQASEAADHEFEFDN